MADINVSMNNLIVHQMGDVYLPVRIMRRDKLGVYGNCAVIACNRGTPSFLGNCFVPYEYAKTEYFIFPSSFDLYDILKDKMYKDDSWQVDKNEWVPTKGEIFNEERIVYFHTSWFLKKIYIPLIDKDLIIHKT